MIPTAEEFCNDMRYVTYSLDEKLITFAKMHVEEALKEASEEAYVEVLDYDDDVWCITTKNTTVISRREGKVLISGNSSPEGVLNAGTMKLANLDTIFSNGSVVTDGKFGKVSSHGNIFEL